MAGEDALDDSLRTKIHKQAMGNLLPGIVRLREEPSVCSKVNNLFAMMKIALIG